MIRKTYVPGSYHIISDNRGICEILLLRSSWNDWRDFNFIKYPMHANE